VYQQGADLHYRTRSVACYTRPGQHAPSCFDTRAVDPLFATSLTPVPEDPALSAFFRRVLRADRQVNRAQPGGAGGQRLPRESVARAIPRGPPLLASA
jgi:hypothetical protein